MASISRWVLTILKVIGGLVAAGFLLFVVACLLWWWAWTNTGEMNRQRDELKTSGLRYLPPDRIEAGPVADTLGRVVR